MAGSTCAAVSSASFSLPWLRLSASFAHSAGGIRVVKTVVCFGPARPLPGGRPVPHRVTHRRVRLAAARGREHRGSALLGRWCYARHGALPDVGHAPARLGQASRRLDRHRPHHGGQHRPRWPAAAGAPVRLALRLRAAGPHLRGGLDRAAVGRCHLRRVRLAPGHLHAVHPGHHAGRTAGDERHHGPRHAPDRRRPRCCRGLLRPALPRLRDRHPHLA